MYTLALKHCMCIASCEIEKKLLLGWIHFEIEDGCSNQVRLYKSTLFLLGSMIPNIAIVTRMLSVHAIRDQTISDGDNFDTENSCKK
jgi:hypothetical protein